MTSCHDFYDSDVERQVVVVGVDGSPGSHAALRWAIDHAHASGARLLAVNVFEPVVPMDFTGAGYAAMSVTDPRMLRRAGHDLIDRMVREAAQGRTVDVQPLVLEAHNPGQALVRAARKASMLVVGAHHRHGLGFLLGSTGASCVRHAGCPVLVVPENWYARTSDEQQVREQVLT
jgi:nucleotide-binding universal stress UspA family protein